MLVQINEAAEKAVLAGLCQYGSEAHIDISDLVTIDTFGNENHQIIFKCIDKSVKENRSIDLPTILASATSLGLYDIIKDRELDKEIESIFSFPVNLPNVREHAKQIKKLEIARKLSKVLSEINKKIKQVDGSESIDEILSLAEKPVLDFANSLTSEDQPELIGKNIEEYIQYIRENPNKPAGIPSGFAKYDDAIGGGFRRKTVSLIGARIKVGKSIFADNVAIHVAGRLKIPVLMIDTEMSANDHYNRLLAYHTKIPINFIEAGKWVDNPICEEKIYKQVKKIKEMPYTYKNVSGKGFNEILSIIHRWIHKEVGFDENGKTNDCLVIYDYFKLMTSDPIKDGMAEFQVLGFQISDLHNFCVKYDFPVLSFVQLNRDGITKESTDVVSQSDRLLWLCTNFSIFKAKTEEEIIDDGAEFGNRKLIPLIARHGPAFEDGNYINMSMQGEFAMIGELNTKFENIKNNKDIDDNDDEEAPFD